MENLSKKYKIWLIIRTVLILASLVLLWSGCKTILYILLSIIVIILHITHESDLIYRYTLKKMRGENEDNSN